MTSLMSVLLVWLVNREVKVHSYHPCSWLRASLWAISAAPGPAIVVGESKAEVVQLITHINTHTHTHTLPGPSFCLSHSDSDLEHAIKAGRRSEKTTKGLLASPPPSLGSGDWAVGADKGSLAPCHSHQSHTGPGHLIYSMLFPHICTVDLLDNAMTFRFIRNNNTAEVN